MGKRSKLEAKMHFKEKCTVKYTIDDDGLININLPPPKQGYFLDVNDFVASISKIIGEQKLVYDKDSNKLVGRKF